MDDWVSIAIIFAIPIICLTLLAWFFIVRFLRRPRPKKTLVVIVLLASPLIAFILLFLVLVYKAWSLEKGFEANVPVYPDSQVISAEAISDDLNITPVYYEVYYKIDSKIPFATVTEFYNEQLQKNGWQADSNNSQYYLTFVRGKDESIRLYLNCTNSPDDIFATVKKDTCADTENSDRDYFEAHIYYSNNEFNSPPIRRLNIKKDTY